MTITALRNKHFKTLNSTALALVAVIIPWVCVSAQAQQTSPTPTNLQLLDGALNDSLGSSRVVLDDMLFPRTQFQAYRNSIAAGQEGGRSTRSAFYNTARWTGGRVYYSFDAGLPTTQRTAFVAACREWEKWANLKFSERTTEANYIRVYQDANGGSFSYIGMVGGSQDMSLASWANTWTAAHEIGHALGVMHEQCRSDRDNYVTINFANVQSGTEGNFAIVSNSLNQGAYDFDSVMHYPSTAFAINSSQPTIVPKAGYTQYQNTMGQRSQLSPVDKSGMAAIYGAPGTTTTPTPTPTVTPTPTPTPSVAAPANDLFSRATVLSGSSGTVTGTNVGATKETGEPNHAGNGGTSTVWYKWTAPASGSATVVTAGSTFDTILAVYTGTTVGALTSIASNDDVSSSVSTSSVTFNVVAGTAYSIVVNGYKSGSANTATGNITLKWTGPAAPALYSLGGTVSASTGALSGVTLSLSGAKSATTSSSSTGAYNFASLAAGTYTVTPSKAGYTFSPTSRQIPLSGNVSNATFTATTTAAPSVVTISAPSIAMVEGNAGTQYMSFNVSLSEPSSQTVTVNFATADGSAVAGSDYVARSGTLTFPAGATIAEVRVTIIPDRVVENNESFYVVLSNPAGATLNMARGMGNIVNDDRASAPQAPASTSRG